METRRTVIGKHQKTKACGIVLIIMGIGGFMLSPLIFPPFWIIGGILCLSIGITYIKKGDICEAVCPYCNNKIRVFEKELTHKCQHCKKISNVRSNMLETIE